MARSYKAFLNALGERESSGNYSAENRFGYLGKYQFGELALRDVGYYTNDGTSANDWGRPYWTRKHGVDSKAEFLADHAAGVRHPGIHDPPMAVHAKGLGL